MPEQRTEKAVAKPAATQKSPLDQAIDALVIGRNSDPFALLGPHQVDAPPGRRWVIRMFHPGATTAAIRFTGVGARLIGEERLRAGGHLVDAHRGHWRCAGRELLRRLRSTDRPSRFLLL